MAKKKPPSADAVGLLQAVLAAPEDDTPRLVFADFLEEHREPNRAEFIRVQCRLAGLDAYDPERPHLVWRVRQLLTDARRKAWGELPVKPVQDRTFHRGFVDDVAIRTALLVDGAEAIFAQIPLRRVRLLQVVKPAWDRLLASPYLLRIHGLDLHNSSMSAARCKALAACERAANLRDLHLGSNRMVGPAGLHAILASRHLGNLRRLTLTNNDYGNDALAAFVGNKNFPHLRHLDLATEGPKSEGIGPAGVDHLGRAAWLSQLESLDLSGNPLGDEGVKRLAESGILAGSTSLRLRNVDLGIDGVRALVRSPHVRNLRELSLDRTKDGDFLKEIAGSTELTSLRVLKLHHGTTQTAADVRAFVASPVAARLRVLALTDFLPAEAFTTILSAPSLAGLTRLNLWGSEHRGGTIDVVGLLRSATHLKDLHSLELMGNELTDRDVAEVAGFAHLGGLTELLLHKTQLTEAGIDAVIASPHLTNLRRLELGYKPTGPDDPVLDRLTARFGEGVYSYG